MTIKKKRTLASVLVALCATATMAVTASAASYTYDFYFELDSATQTYSAASKKQNSLNYASVLCDEGNFINSDRLYLRVCENYKADDYVYEFATETKWINGPYNFDLNYYNGHGVKGRYYRLRGYQDADLINLYASGTWQP